MNPTRPGAVRCSASTAGPSGAARQQSRVGTITGPVRMPTRHGEFQAYAYACADGVDHLALVLGDVAGPDVLVRVHSSCLTGDALGSERCDCGPQLQEALRRIAEEGRGVVVYLQQEGRGIGLANKIRAYALQDRGADTVAANLDLGFEADARDYSAAADVLRALGVESVRLLTNNPAKVAALTELRIPVAERVPIAVGHTSHNAHYLETKRALMGHFLPGDEDVLPDATSD